jgi:molybdopterin-guanine dinucleotide biosynthesis adapter protein
MKVIGLAGWSGAGKTTLVKKLIPVLIARGLTVSTLKHAHRLAGATEVLVSSEHRWALMHELRGAPEPPVIELLTKLSPVDLVLIEGFKRGPHPKLEIHRAANGKPLLAPDDETIVAIASDVAMPQIKLPIVGLDDVEKIADMLIAKAALVEKVVN